MSSVNQQISQILLDASSPDAETRKIADAKLKEWEHTPNFYPTLLVQILSFFLFIMSINFNFIII